MRVFRDDRRTIIVVPSKVQRVEFVGFADRRAGIFVASDDFVLEVCLGPTPELDEQGRSQKLIVVRTPAMTASRSRRSGLVGGGIPPPVRWTYWKSG